MFQTVGQQLDEKGLRRRCLFVKFAKCFQVAFFIEYLYTAAPEHLLYTYATATLKEHIVNIN